MTLRVKVQEQAMRSAKRILVPIDFSKSSRAALERAADLARGLGASLELIHVYEPSGYVGPGSLTLFPAVNLTQRWEQARAQIRREVAAFVGREHADVPVRIELGKPSDIIAAAAREGDFDLVIMGAHGGAGLSRVVGNVTEEVMRKAHCPVMTVHLPDRQAVREAVPM